MDALRHADLPGGPALDPRLPLRGGRGGPRQRLAKVLDITLPLVLPFLMLAVLFRGIENFKMFDMVVELTSGGPGSTTELASINLKREAFEKWRTGYSSAFAIILFVTVFGARQHLRQGAQQGEAAMTAPATEPTPSYEPTAVVAGRFAAVAGGDLRADHPDARWCGSS